jgi:hypothetical protein
MYVQVLLQYCYYDCSAACAVIAAKHTVTELTLKKYYCLVIDGTKHKHSTD